MLEKMGLQCSSLMLSDHPISITDTPSKIQSALSLSYHIRCGDVVGKMMFVNQTQIPQHCALDTGWSTHSFDHSTLFSFFLEMHLRSQSEHVGFNIWMQD